MTNEEAFKKAIRLSKCEGYFYNESSPKSTRDLIDRLKLNYHMPLYTNNICMVSRDDVKFIIEYLMNSIPRNDLLKEIERIEYDAYKTKELKKIKKVSHEFTDYDKNRLGAYITKSNEIAKRLRRLLEK